MGWGDWCKWCMVKTEHVDVFRMHIAQHKQRDWEEREREYAMRCVVHDSGSRSWLSSWTQDPIRYLFENHLPCHGIAEWWRQFAMYVCWLQPPAQIVPPMQNAFTDDILVRTYVHQRARYSQTRWSIEWGEMEKGMPNVYGFKNKMTGKFSHSVIP